MKPLIKTFSIPLVCIVGAISMWATGAMARQSLVIHQNADSSGYGKMIPLKARLKQAYPRLNLQDAELLGVTVEARSRRGGDSVELVVGGRGQEVRSVSPSLNNIELSNYCRYCPGPWKLRVDGHVYIRRIIVHIEEAWDHGGGGRYDRVVSLGIGEADGLYERDREVFNGSLMGVNSIKIEALDNGLHVQRVMAVFGNGQRVRLVELEGGFHRGETVVVRVGQRHLKRLIVTAVSTSRYRARYEVSAVTGR